MRRLSESFIELGEKQSLLFEENNVVYCECLVKFDSPRHVLLLAYDYLVREKKIKGIEALTEPEKRMIWDWSKDLAKGRMNKKQLIELSKALYTIEYYLSWH